MKKTILILILAICATGKLWAFDFSYTYGGQTLYYDITSTSPRKVEVVHPVDGWPFWNATEEPTGHLSIPSSVSYGGNNYSVTSIGDYAFYDCFYVTAITIPSSVTSIGDWAFCNCSGLTSISIPTLTNSIGGGAFADCSSLTSINVNSTNAYYSSSNGILFNKNQTTLMQCPAGKSGTVTIPNSVTRIEDCAFYGCSSLTSVSIPNSVACIGAWAFEYCSSLTSITIPTPVTIIEYEAFYACTSLTSVYMKGDTPPSLGVNAFVRTDLNLNIYVPCSALSAYQNSTDWNSLNLISKLPTAIVNTSNNLHGTATVLSTSCTATTIQATANTGYRFSHWSDNDTHSLRSLALSAYDTINLTAYFESLPGWYDIVAQASSSSQGSVSGGGHLQGNTTATLTATPKAHYHFDHWQDGNTSNPRTITVTGNATYTAYFAIDQHTITLTSNDASLGTVSGGGTFNYGAQAQISATVTADHYHFARWSDGNTSNPRTITVSSDLSLTGIFEIDQHTITATSENSTMGSVSGAGSYEYGSTATLTATPRTGYQFVRWSDGSDDNPYNILVTEDATYTAYFIRSTGIADAETDGVVITVQNGRIVCNGCQGKVVAIYDQIGRTILSPSRHTEDLLACPVNRAGIYIVRINNTTSHKVLVR